MCEAEHQAGMDRVTDEAMTRHNVGAERAARLAVEAGAMPVAVRSSEGLGLWPKRGNHDV